MASRHTRCPPTLHGPARARFLATQDHYDRMLAAEGFEDLEGGSDLARATASSVSAARNRDRPHRLSMAPGEAAFWRLVGAAAGELPRNYRGRAFVVTVAASGNLSAAARRHGLTPMRARWLFKRFLVAHGLGDSRPARSTYSGDGRWRSRRVNG